MVRTMPKAERKRLILKFLNRYPLALPLRPLYYNMKREMNITYTEETMGNYLSELVADGLLRKHDRGNGYYELTEAGRDHLADADEF